MKGLTPRIGTALLTIGVALCSLLAPLSAAANPDALFIVNSSGDSTDASPGNGICATAGGGCTLRAAIVEANAFAGADTIAFAIGAGKVTIAPTSALPAITDAVTIDGTTQPGYRGLPIVELDGSSAGAAVDGLTIQGLTTVRALVVNRFSGAGINVAHRLTLQGSYVGTDISGTLDRGNGGPGILFGLGGSTGLIGGPTVGGPMTGPGNLISGNNGGGIVFSSSGTGNVVQGNLIGTNLTASAKLGNTGPGISVANGSPVIGGPGDGNVIAGNTSDGITVTGSGATIDGNFIGTDPSTTVNLGNTGNGIALASSNNIVGANARNTVYFNTGAGIRVTSGTQNPLGQNTAFFNGGLGIDLGTAGVTGNDAGDGDSGPNNLQNFPVLSSPSLSAAGTTVTFHVALNSTAFAHFEIDYYVSPSCDTSGNGEGAHFAGSTANVQANSSGNLSLNKTVFADPGEVVTATATKLAGPSFGVVETSEFSQCMDVPFAHTFTVNSIGDGPDANPGNGTCATSTSTCTLRAAILETNALAGRDLVAFGIGAGAKTIVPASALPGITEALTIDGRTQPGFAVDPLIELDGTSAGSNVIGLTIAGNRVTVRALAINRFSRDGIRIASGTDAVIQGNRIGTDRSGASPLGNGGNGVTIQGPRALVGGAENSTFGNVISANQGDGILINALLADVQRNRIGTNNAGTIDLGNGGDGVKITAPVRSVIGGRSASFRNVISGNDENGVEILGSGASSAFGNSALGNFIGLGSNGSTVLPNSLAGVRIGPGAARSNVGGTRVGDGNVISANGAGGIVAIGAGTTETTVRGNLIGTDANGTLDRGNAGPGVSVSGAPAVLIGGAPAPQRNVISGNAGPGVLVSGVSAAGATILGNTIGLKAGGAGALGNDADGVFLQSSEAVVGGPDLGAGNVLGSNGQAGVTLSTSQASGATILGNLIGVDVNSITAGNGSDGIAIAQAADTAIGGPDPGDGNVISGNGSDGIQIAGVGATGTTVEGNRIGTNLTGQSSTGNTQAGIRVLTSGTTIGGNEPGSSNQISGNQGDGVLIVGPAATGTAVSGNRIGLRPGTGIGQKLGNLGNGVLISNAPNNSIGSVQAHNQIGANSLDGVRISGAGATNNAVAGNEIGTDGTVDLGNAHAGIVVVSPGATIGSVAAPNVISGNNQNGVEIEADDATVQGNLIGLNAAGTGGVPNTGDGVRVLNAANAVIGDEAGASQNLIGGNTLNGIELTGPGTTGTKVVHNVIGRSGALGAANAVGIRITDGASNSLIGGVTAQGPSTNVIRLNSFQGIAIDSGIRNRIQGNSVDLNGGLGIDLGPGGVTPNDAKDPDTGANNLQNFPTITSAVTGGGVVSVAGSINSTPLTVFTIDVYASPSCDAAGNGEGATFVGSFAIQPTNSNGDRVFVTHDLPTTIPPNQAITITATDPDGNTSEFSPCFVAPEAFADLSADLADSPDPVTHGNNLTYTVTVTNGGPNRAIGSTLTQTLGRQLTFVSATPTVGSCALTGNRVVCSLGKLAPSQTITVTIVATVSAGFTGTLSNTATAASGVTDPDPADNASTETTTVN